MNRSNAVMNEAEATAPMHARLSPRKAQERLDAAAEIAFLDVREAGPFSLGHPLFATPCPFSLFEARVGELAPRLDTPVLLIDGGEGLAELAARIMADMGYGALSVVEGGAPAWQAAGLPLYRGVNVPSKVLGELAAEHMGPDAITAHELVAWRENGTVFHLFDCRPPAEYARMTVPGARCLPNGELAHRLAALSLDGGPVVLTCAGRTRGLVGALGLAMIAPDMEVYALENGTQGWALAGYDLQRDNAPAPFPDLDRQAWRTSEERFRSFAARHDICVADADTVQRLVAEPGRTTFLLDVRAPDEAMHDPLPGFRHAPSGQLVQASDQWLGVRGARLVLADAPGLRAALAAYWLRLMGFEPHVVPVTPGLRRISPPPRPQPDLPQPPLCSAEEALALHRAGAVRLLDVRTSSAFRACHVVGSEWAIRPALAQMMQGETRPVLLVGDESARAPLAARELLRLGHGDARLVDGGLKALQCAGACVVHDSREPAPLQAADVTWFAHGRHDGNLAASREYLAWECGLVAQLSPAERQAFLL